MISDGLNVRPGDWIESKSGICGVVKSVCTFFLSGNVVCVEIGDEWVSMNDVVYWGWKI